MAHSDTKPKIEIYTRAMCGYSARAVAWFRDRNLEFIEYDAGMDMEKRTEMHERSNGGTTFPQILINGRPIGGYDDLMALEQSKDLETLLS